MLADTLDDSFLYSDIDLCNFALPIHRRHRRAASCAFRAELRKKTASQKEHRSFADSPLRSRWCRVRLLRLENNRPLQQDSQQRNVSDFSDVVSREGRPLSGCSGRSVGWEFWLEWLEEWNQRHAKSDRTGCMGMLTWPTVVLAILVEAAEAPR